MRCPLEDIAPFVESRDCSRNQINAAPFFAMCANSNVWSPPPSRFHEGGIDCEGGREGKNGGHTSLGAYFSREVCPPYIMSMEKCYMMPKDAKM